MPENPPKSISTAEICTLAGIDSPVEEVSAQHFLESLIAKQLYPEAVRFAANAIEPRAAIEWACNCLKQLSELRTQERKTARGAVEQWLTSGTEESRRASHDAAQAAGLDSADGVLAMAVFMSGGSIAPPSAPAVPPPPQVCQKLAAGAVALAVVSDKPDRAAERFQQALKLAKIQR